MPEWSARMASPQDFRLYTFVAGLYLSDLQKGLQTAHVVSEIADQMENHRKFGGWPNAIVDFQTWASQDKTIIICNAHNHQGVKDCWAEIRRINSALGLPAAIFHEDEQSMNGMATACGVIVPKRYWDVVYEDGIQNGLGFERYVHSCDFRPDGSAATIHAFPLTHAQGQFIKHIKQYHLA
jgi:hypothetical protein